MKSIKEEPYTVDLKISLLGIRKLAKASNKAELEVFLTDSKSNQGKSPMEAYLEGRERKARRDGDDEGAKDDSQEEEERMYADERDGIDKDQVEFRKDKKVRVF